MLARHVKYREKNMSDIHYEKRQLALWHEYDQLNGFVSFDAFMERHVNVNAWIVNLLKQGHDCTEFDRAVWDDPMHPNADDYADAYANPTGGI